MVNRGLRASNGVRKMLHDIAKLDERCHVLGSNAAVRRVSASLSRWQADWWTPLPLIAVSRLQAGWANGQRGTKRQPDRGSRRSGGLPPIGTSSSALDNRSG